VVANWLTNRRIAASVLPQQTSQIESLGILPRYTEQNNNEYKQKKRVWVA